VVFSFEDYYISDQRSTDWKLTRIMFTKSRKRLCTKRPCEAKKTAPFYFYNSFFKPSSIRTIFGTHIPQ